MQCQVKITLDRRTTDKSYAMMSHWPLAVYVSRIFLLLFFFLLVEVESQGCELAAIYIRGGMGKRLIIATNALLS